MIVANDQTYSQFKSNFDSLGGSKRTTVVAFDQTLSGGAFQVVAAFDSIALQLYLPAAATRPANFATDFPQAVFVDQNITVN